MRIGIFGGSFNPPHTMHRDIALELIDKGYLNKVIYVPTGNSYDKSGLIDFSHRFKMLEIMASNNDSLIISDLGNKENYEYTYQVLDYFRAIYTDADGQELVKTLEIALSGTSKKQPNILAVKDDLKETYTIYQGLSYNDIFDNLGNGEGIAFTYTYVGGSVDGDDASDLIQVSKFQNNNYTITANEVESITEPRTVKVVATQSASSTVFDKTIEIILTVVPPVQWNWADLYFGETYFDPITLQGENVDWTLTELSDAANLVRLTKGEDGYSVEVGTGDANTVYEAKFKFEQGNSEKEFTSKIYADPRKLPMCVDAVHKYRGVTKSATGGVSFAEATNGTITMNGGASWEIQMIGTPDKLIFTPNGVQQWTIEESGNGTTWSGVLTQATLANGQHTFSLAPTTRFVRIGYGASSNAEVGQISALCITKLDIKADVDAVYFPIKATEATTKTVTLMHTANLPQNGITLGNGFETAFSNATNLGSDDDPCYQTTLTITGSSATVTKGSYTMTVTQEDGASVVVPIHADVVPQGLPIKLATDDVKRYHFIATASQYVKWDAAERQIVFQNPNVNGPVARWVDLEDAYQMIERGEIKDSKTVIALLWYKSGLRL